MPIQPSPSGLAQTIIFKSVEATVASLCYETVGAEVVSHLTLVEQNFYIDSFQFFHRAL
jgi:hypothetical protein